MGDQSIKVLVLAEEALLRWALGAAIEMALPEAEVTLASRLQEAELLLAEAPQHVCLIGDEGSQGAGLRLLRAVRAASPDLPLILLSASDDGDTVSLALESGADGYVLMDSTPEDLASAVRVVRTRSGKVISPRAATNLSRAGANGAARGPSQTAVQVGLTRREEEVLGLLAGGATNRQISRQLFLSEKTVKAHVASAFRRLGVQNRTQAALAAAAMGLAGWGARATNRPAYQPGRA